MEPFYEPCGVEMDLLGWMVWAEAGFPAGVGASWSITYNDINPLTSGRVAIEASMGHGRVDRTNAGLFFCINLAEGRRERFGRSLEEIER
jgi:hypothetical protein